MTPADVIQLFQEPEKLLRKCYLHIAGGATRTPTLPHLAPPPANGQAQIATFRVEIDDAQAVKGFTTGFSGLVGKKKDRAFVKITKQAGPAKVAPAADEFNAYYIPMVQTSDVTNNTSHYTLPTGGGALDLMITSKLSGCTFKAGSDAHGATLVSHVQPDLSITDMAQRSQDLSTAVGTGFNDVSGQFRKRKEYSDKAAVIGRRTGTRWTFYLQALTNTTTHVISKVKTVS